MSEPAREAVEAIARAVSAVIERQPEVLGVYLFGSHLTGEARARSDIDLGILFDQEPSLAEVVDLETELEDALGRRVDVVDVGRAGPFLALEIVRGERIWEGDGLRCDLFDLYVLRRAGDLAHFERERRRLLLTPPGTAVPEAP
jgi:predicted nucleotidyltransferase